MALPTILLREFRTATISDWIPGKLAQTYEQLESLAFDILSKSSADWNVHFHFEDGICEGKALRILWDNGLYFDDDALKGGKLHLYAHFVRKDGTISASQARTWSAAPPSRTPTNVSSHGVTESSPRTALDDFRLPLTSPRYQSVHTMRSAAFTSQKRKRANVHNLSDSDSEGSGETQFILSASDREKDSDDDDDDDDGEEEEEEDSQLEPNAIQRQLDSDTKAAQRILDFKTAIATNAPYGKYGHKKDWNLLAEEQKHRIAHARLIKGAYGCPSPTPCVRCEQKGLACRMYHPDLRTISGCGECIATANECDLDDKSQSTMQKVGAAKSSQNTPSHKVRKLRNNDGSRKFFDYCPVITCTRRTEPFTHKPNFLRHIRCAHPEYNETRVDTRARASIPTQRALAAQIPQTTIHHRTSKGGGTFACPVENCQSPSAGGFSREDNFRRHVRLTHPESIHAQIIEAIAQKKRITLPPPPSTDDYTTDFDAAVSNNAPLGAIGHRPTAQWAKADIGSKVRIAHAKLIHSKHGVIAPKSCDSCRGKGTTCLVYHPGLKNVGRDLGTYCGECRDRDVECGMRRDVFDEILLLNDDDEDNISHKATNEDEEEHAQEDGRIDARVEEMMEHNFNEPIHTPTSLQGNNKALDNVELEVKQEDDDDRGVAHLKAYAQDDDIVIDGEDSQPTLDETINMGNHI